MWVVSFFCTAKRTLNHFIYVLKLPRKREKCAAVNTSPAAQRFPKGEQQRVCLNVPLEKELCSEFSLVDRGASRGLQHETNHAENQVCVKYLQEGEQRVDGESSRLS